MALDGIDWHRYKNDKVETTLGQMFQDTETVADVPKKIVCFVEMENK